MNRIKTLTDRNCGGPYITYSSFLLLIYISRVSLVSLSAYSIFSLPIVFVLSLIAVAIYYINKRQCKIEACYLFLFAFIFVVFLSALLSSNTKDAEFSAGYLKQLPMLIIAFGTFNYMASAGKNEKTLLARFYLICTLITTGYTCYVASTGNPGIIRHTAFGKYDDSFTFIYGGYDFIYALVIMYTVLLAFYKHTKKQLKSVTKVLIIAILAFFAYTIIISGFTTAFVIILAFTIWNLFSNKWLRCIMIVGVLALLFFLPQAIILLIDAFNFIPDLTATRMNDMILSISGSSNTAYFTNEGERGKLFLLSLKVFFEHPILGGYIGNSSVPVGGHSELVDTLARFGLIAYTCFCAFWVGVFKRMDCGDDLSSVAKKCVRIAFLTFIILGVFDTVSMTNTIVPIFAFAPFCEEIFGVMKKDSE